MKIDELIEQLEAIAEGERWIGSKQNADLLNLAAQKIRLLWEIAQDNSNSKYRRQIDEMRGDDAKVG